MKILLVITGLGMGGAEHMVVNLADALVERGHQVKIAYLTGPALVLPKNSRIEVIPIGMQGYKDFFRAYVKLRGLINSFKPEVVHGHMIHANIITRLLRLTTAIPTLISSAHNTDEGGKLRMLAYRLTDKLADAFTNVSQEAVDVFVRKGACPQNRMLSVVNGIDSNIFQFNLANRKIKRKNLGIDQKKMILAVGRLDKQKDYPNLLYAIKLLHSIRQDFKVFIAGDGPLRDELVLLVKKLEIEHYIQFLGLRKDIIKLLSATDLYVMSSAWEGLPMVILEAMACERVVVATDCGGVKEVLGTNGFLVEPQNSEALAQALNKVLDLDENESKKLGQRARQRIVDHFSLDAHVEAFLKLYHRS